MRYVGCVVNCFKFVKRKWRSYCKYVLFYFYGKVIWEVCFGVILFNDWEIGF